MNLSKACERLHAALSRVKKHGIHASFEQGMLRIKRARFMRYGSIPSWQSGKTSKRRSLAPLITHPLQMTYGGAHNLQEADELCAGRFRLFDKPALHCSFDQIPWDRGYEHLAKRPAHTIAITTTVHTSNNASDIRLCWELNRLRQLYILARAAYETKRLDYLTCWQQMLKSWVAAHPFCYGMQWTSPMEVAIRIIHIVWSMAYIAAHPNVSSDCYTNLNAQAASVVHTHMHYLAHTWEKGWNPHNHFLANLVGYLHGARFLSDAPAHTWVYRQLTEQIIHQILSDGGHFEGSVGYHRFVCELLLYAAIVIDKKPINHLYISIEKAFFRMHQFLSDITDHAGNTPTIGDDDSGKILDGLAPITHPPAIATFPTVIDKANFGLSIIRDDKTYISLRHATYNESQPTGHMHQDCLSVTLSLHNVPLFIDPGSYLYTGNTGMRNVMRSWESHSTFYAPAYMPLPPATLFTLPRITQTAHITHIANRPIRLRAYRNISERLRAERTITYTERHTITIADQWHVHETFPHVMVSRWSWIFHPDIQLVKKSPTSWSLYHEGKLYAQLVSSLPIAQDICFYAPSYGSVRQTYALRGSLLIDHTQKHIPTITKIILVQLTGQKPSKDMA